MINGKGQLGILASSARYKRDIHPMGESSQALLALRPVTFRYKQDPSNERQYGLVAEEVAAVYPELVTRTPTGEVQSVRYEELIPMLLNELQRQKQAFGAEISDLEASNGSLRTELQRRDDELRNQNAALLARVARLEESAPRSVSLARR